MHPYVKAVLDSDPQSYWPYGSDGNPLVGSDIITSSAVVFGADGPLLHGDLGSAHFDGTSSFGQVPLGLNGLSLITVEFFLWWTVNASDDDFSMEQSPNANDDPGFNFDWNNSSGGAEANSVSLKVNWGSGSGRWYFPRPTDSPQAWHHVMAVLRAKKEPAPLVFIDGVSQEVKVGDEPSNNEGTFADDTLNFMSRNGAALFGSGKLAHPAIYPADVSADLPAHIAAITAEEEIEPPEPGEFTDARLGWGVTSGGYMINEGAL